jgi:phospholipid-translocating ATPase
MKYTILTPDGKMQVHSEELKVGDFVLLGCDEIVPADLLVLKSAHNDGVCFVQTSQLDGYFSPIF